MILAFYSDKMNRFFNKKLTLYFIIALLVIFLCYILVNIDYNIKNKNEHCELNNISIGMDSANAVNVIKDRWIRTCQLTECYLPFMIKGDSIGYICPKINEVFYIKIKNNKVYDIIFTTNSSNGINCLMGDSIIKIDKDKPSKQIRNNIVIEYNGKNAYHLYKK